MSERLYQSSNGQRRQRAQNVQRITYKTQKDRISSMSMTLIKKTAEYSIFQRGDNRYAVRDAAKQAVNGDEKVRILRAEGLIKIAAPAAPAEPQPETPEEASAPSGGVTPQAQAKPQAAADDTSKDTAAQTSDGG